MVIMIENIDRKDFEEMLHNRHETKNLIERVMVVLDKREKEIKMDWYLFVDLN